jgi:predicted Rossmann-fold nucleotide-binding protein
VNIRGFFDPLLALFERCIREQFMDERHALMWQVADRPEDVLAAMRSQSPWTARAREFATLRAEKRLD